jgi:DNA-binding HxlR family transcriptional regulator
MSAIQKYSTVLEADALPGASPVSTAAVILDEMLQPVTDSLYVLQGKWRLPILLALATGPKRFRELAKALATITDRMLAKELKELEVNLLINRKVFEDMPVKVEYTLTEHGISLHDVLIELQQWGLRHRKKVGLQ